MAGDGQPIKRILPRDAPRNLTNLEKGIFSELDDWIRPYAQAVFNFCKMVDPTTGKDIPQVFTTPERAFAEDVQKLVIDGKEVEKDTIPLPIVGIACLDPIPDLERFNRGTMRKLQYSSDRNSVWEALRPEPYKMPFQVDIRARYTGQLWKILREFSIKFVHAAGRIIVDRGYLGCLGHRVEMEGPVDNSDLEPGEGRDRALRKTYTLTVDGWLVHEPSRVPTARKFTVSAVDMTTNEVLETWVEADE